MNDFYPHSTAPLHNPGSEVARVTGPVFGAVPVRSGTRFRIWAPIARQLTLVVESGQAAGTYEMTRLGDGLFELAVPGARAGDVYRYRVNEGPLRPDPASRFQPEGVHGPSQIVDPSKFAWKHDLAEPTDTSNLVVYELHVGTFTREGTFSAARERLTDIRALGATAVELMPVADFAGRRNWGYDGVCLFAPSRVYGPPDDLRAFVDAAHRLNLRVILDVVYNHLGPEGAYLTEFNPDHVTDRHRTPWGDAVNLDGPGSALVRAFLIDNAAHWIREYHMDGLRLDATHALIDERGEAADRHFVRELADHARAARSPSPIVHAEDHRNLSDIVSPHGWNLDGLWADDFHHVMRRMIAGDEHGYYADFRGTVHELAETIRRGWLFTGQYSQHLQACRGSDPSCVALQRCIFCLQNHDQVGNRAMGDRLHHRVDAAVWRTASTILVTAAATPLLFMGQEWAASTPFCYFTDLEPNLGRQVTEGRRREFSQFPEFTDAAARARIPDPQAVETFARSQLKWEERSEPEHAAVLALYTHLLALRREHAALRASEAFETDAFPLDETTIAVRRASRNDVFWILARLGNRPATVHAGDVPLARCTIVLTTEQPPFALDPLPPVVQGDRVRFRRSAAMILKEG